MVKKVFRITLIIISLFLIYIISEAGGLFSQTDEIIFEIENGASFNQIINNLKENDIINNKFLFKVYSKIMEGNKLSDIKAGKIIIHGKISYGNLLKLICLDTRHS